jgi:hypothetical protein
MKGFKIMKITIPAGRYYFGDISGVSPALVAIPCSASIFYSDDSAFEIEVAGGGSTCYDENAFGVFGLVAFENTGLDDDEFDSDFASTFEVTESTEVIFDFDYFEIVGVVKFSFARDCGLLFTSTSDEFEVALN